MDKNTVEELKKDQRIGRLFNAVESRPVIVMIMDASGDIAHVNAKFLAVTGYSVSEVLGMNLRELLDQDLDEKRRMWAGLKSGREWEGKFLNLKPGGTYWDEGTIFPIRDSLGRVTHLVKVAEDITERKHAEEILRSLAFFDDVTDLPNKRLFNDRLRQALALNRRNKEVLAVMSLELDNFSIINSSLGHEAGDQVLRAISERVGQRLRVSDTLSLYSGNSFKVLLAQIAHPEDAAKVAQGVLQSIAPAITLGDRAVHVSASIGIALFPGDGEEESVLLKNADLALLRIREQGGRNGFRFFTPSMNERAMKRMSLESDLRKALDAGEFLVNFQPQFDSRTGALAGSEALVRWAHPEKGVVLPDEYIPLSEETGLILPLGEWVLRNSCLQNRTWHALGAQGLNISVNLSVRQFAQPDLTQMVRQILEETGHPPELLELEITESAIMGNLDRAMEILHELKSMGVSIALDDFGTGYSSLSHLTRFPIDTIKIDKSFVRDVCENAGHAAIVSAIVAMAHSIGLKVVAEGVETQPQLDFLKALGCDLIQGYLLGRPVSGEAFVRFIG